MQCKLFFFPVLSVVLVLYMYAMTIIVSCSWTLIQGTRCGFVQCEVECGRGVRMIANAHALQIAELSIS